MQYEEIDTIDDALSWLRAQSTVSRMQLHMLEKEFLSDPRFHELREVVDRHGINVTGDPAL